MVQMKYYAESNRRTLERLREKRNEIARKMKISKEAASELIAKSSAEIFKGCNDTTNKTRLYQFERKSLNRCNDIA